MVEKTCLKLHRLQLSPEMFIAIEYSADRYMSWTTAREIANVSWESAPMLTDDLVRILRARGWHTTDIGDELNEARAQSGPVA